MKLNGFIKRAFFFLAAFAVGITATGLLFGFQAPRFGHRHREGKRQYIQDLKVQVAALTAQNAELSEHLQRHQLDVNHACGMGMGTDEGMKMGELPFASPPTAPRAPAAQHNHK